MQTKSLKLVPQTLEEVRAMVEAMTPSEKTELSADWLALLRASTASDPWTHGFSFVHRRGMKGRRRRVGFVCLHSFVIPIGHPGLEFLRGSAYDFAEQVGGDEPPPRAPVSDGP
jgi:hypothetical protein